MHKPLDFSQHTQWGGHTWHIKIWDTICQWHRHCRRKVIKKIVYDVQNNVFSCFWPFEPAFDKLYLCLSLKKCPKAIRTRFFKHTVVWFCFFHLPLQQNHALMTSLCMSSLHCIILVFFYALFVKWSMFCLANIALFAQSSLFGLANIFNALKNIPVKFEKLYKFKTMTLKYKKETVLVDFRQLYF